MGKVIKISNLKKTYYYLKKNGLKNAYYAAKERLEQEKNIDYHYIKPSEEELQSQRIKSKNYVYQFSILVPAYETNPLYLREMIDSVLNQTYSKLELVIADASVSDKVERIIESYDDIRIKYIRLKENKGISANTNAALERAEGDYIGLLDHDDVLTPDALFEMADAINRKEEAGEQAFMLYSDEDKGNGECTEFYEPHFKMDFNIDLLLSNNYICHFLVMKSELMKKLKFRPSYDGAQDYDLVLRAMEELHYKKKDRKTIVHIAKVLYHWRCHAQSTAENPESKRYAYDAGRHAVEDFIGNRGWVGNVSDSLHLGFYKIKYETDILAQRPEVGVIGGLLLNGRKRIMGGIYDENGNALYAGLRKEYSGYMHRGSLNQEVFAVDIRCMKVREELIPIFEEVFGTPYIEDSRTGYFAYEEYSAINYKIKKHSMEFCRKVRKNGYEVVWTPDMSVTITDKN